MTAIASADQTELPRSSKPFTPEILGDRWGCSAEKVRLMFHRGEIAGFRLGKLIRIPAIEVERFECESTHPATNMNSCPIGESSLSRLAAEEIAAGYRLARMTRA